MKKGRGKLRPFVISQQVEYWEKEEEPMEPKGKWLDEYCNSCGRQINTWDKRISKVLAYKYPCCEDCIVKEYDMEPEDLRRRMENVFGMRPCLGL